MRILFTLIISFITLITVAQERTVSGTLTSTEDGTPIPGISITIKGTNTGTTTDSNGYYSINAPIGSTLVFSFVGFQTREILVTENNLKPITGKGRNSVYPKSNVLPIPKSLYQDSTKADEVGVATLTDNAPTYLNKGVIDPNTIRSIKRFGDKYHLTIDPDPFKRKGIALIFKTSVSIEQANKLPEFQDTYSQGRPNGNNYEWVGADQREIFSWGPLIKTLEFDGSDYPFDKNGKLVPAGSGNGKSARKYNPLSVFRTAISNVSEIILTLPGPKSSTLVLDFENRMRGGIIQNSDYSKTNFSVSLKDFRPSSTVKLSSSVSYISSSGNLLQRGGNLTSVVSSIFRTPVTFDNRNSYILFDGGLRSHAPGFADNPYGLINDLPDNEKNNRLISTFNLQVNPHDRVQFIFNGTIENQNNQSIFGNAPGYSGFAGGKLTERNDGQLFGNVSITSLYSLDNYPSKLKFSLTYQSNLQNRSIHRIDGSNFTEAESFGQMNEAGSITIIRRNFNRTTHEIIFNTHYERDNWLNIRITNNSYFSNTINQDQITNLFPAGSINVNLADLLSLWPVDNLTLYGTISRTIREAPLLYSDWSHASTLLPIETYPAFYEEDEIFHNSSLSPETEVKFETGVKVSLSSLFASVGYYNNLTNDFIAPVRSSDKFQLSNVATVNNYGAIISLGYAKNSHNIYWGTDLRWSKSNSIVKELYENETIPLAGFESVQTVLAKGKPVGAIYGTTYLENSEGKQVISDDGFPIENQTLKMIGNPLPDWVLGWSSFMNWKNLRLYFLFDYRRGGDTWNGTQAVLDYLGRSFTTGDLRGVANYVFDGVDIQNKQNLIPVNFSDPTKPLDENRWVRYGWDGVGEAYIEDASVFRLSDISLSYSKNLSRGKIKQITLALVGRNLFMRTNYNGVDPSSTLFGYANGVGLDLFNLPTTRSYGAQIKIKL